MKTPASLIGHLDADCFYVSCERVRHPALRGVPVGVLGNQGACVIAKSYEMKARGVTTGMPIWEALRRCPDGVYVKRDFRWYEVISRLLLRLLRQVSPRVEFYSIDEMFFDAAEMPRAFGQPLAEAARSLQQRVLEEVGVPVSIGIAPSKTLAKLASDAAKPLGCIVLTEERAVEGLLRRQPVEEISGIGQRSRRKLAAQGILTCWDFAQADRRLIRRLLTVKGEALWWELRGQAVTPLETTRPPHKCIGRGGSVGKTVTDPQRLFAWLVRNLERLIEALDHYQVLTDQLSLWLEFRTGEGGYARASLPQSTADFEVLLSASKRLLNEIWRDRHPVSGMHLLAERLRLRHEVQASLFDRPDPRRRRLAELKRQINQKVGRFALRSGATLPLADIYADEANEYDICDVAGKFCF